MRLVVSLVIGASLVSLLGWWRKRQREEMLSGTYMEQLRRVWRVKV